MATARKTTAVKPLPMPTFNLEDTMNTKEAANYLGQSPRTLEEWRVRLVGPPYYKPAGTSMVLYLTQEIDEWLRSSRVEPKSK